MSGVRFGDKEAREWGKRRSGEPYVIRNTHSEEPGGQNARGTLY